MDIIFPQGKWIAVDNKTPWKFIFWNFQIYRTLFCLLTLLVRYLLKSLRYLHLPNVENITNQETTSRECLTAGAHVSRVSDSRSPRLKSVWQQEPTSQECLTANRLPKYWSDIHYHCFGQQTTGQEVSGQVVRLVISVLPGGSLRL